MIRGSRARLLAGTAGIAAAVFLSRVRLATQEFSADEIYHVLAAKQWLSDGTLRIHDGAAYERAKAFTLAVAATFDVFGDGVLAARLPALLCGAALPALAFSALCVAGHRRAAWIVATLIALDPELVRLSVMCRFYAPQQLLFGIGAVAFFVAVTPRHVDSTPRGEARSKDSSAPRGGRSVRALGGWMGALRSAAPRLVASAIAVCALAAADALQEVTRIGVGALVVHAMLVQAAPAARALRARPWLAMPALATVALAVGLAIQSGWIAALREQASYVDYWARDAANNPRFYHGWLLDAWPTAWSLYLVALLVAATIAPRIALFCGCVFFAGLFVHSCMAFKSPRFVSYLLPFLWIPWGLALSRLVPALDPLLRETFARGPQVIARHAGWLATAATIGAVTFTIAANSGFARGARLLSADPSWRDSITSQGTLSWTRAAAALGPELTAADVVVTTDDLKSLYYLGRADYVLNVNHLYEDLPLDGPPRPEFTLDPKTHLRLVSRPESLARIFACHPRALLVAQTGFLAADWFVPPDTRAWLLANTRPVPLPTPLGVTALKGDGPTKGTDLGEKTSVTTRLRDHDCDLRAGADLSDTGPEARIDGAPAPSPRPSVPLVGPSPFSR